MREIHTPVRNLLLVAMAFAGALGGKVAFAQTTLLQADDETWRFAVGAGAFNSPKYPGSGDTRTVPVPVLSASYGRYFIGATPGAGAPLGVGVNFVRNEHWRAGVAVGGQLTKPRKGSDAERLNGWGDIPATALGSAFAAYTIDWFTVRGTVISDIAGKHQGTRVALDLEGKYRPNDSLTLSAGPGVTWADGSYSRRFFGIDAGQSAIAGVPPYEAGSGINTLRFSVGAEYRFDQRWALGAIATAARLQGDAADSPITEDKSQNVYGIFVTYRF